MTFVGRAWAVVGLGLVGSAVRFDTAPGTEVVRTFELASSTEFEDWTVVFNGREAPAEHLPELWIEGLQEARAVVRDTVSGCADGRVSALERHFEELEAREVLEVSLGGVPIEGYDAEGECALAGCKVRFEDGKWRLEQGSAPDGALTALELDLDFAALLHGANGEADAWEAPAAALAPFGLPGGIAFEFEGVPEGSRVDPEEWVANLEGTWRVRRLETRAEGALEVFAVEGELSTRCVRATDLDAVPIVDGQATETTTTNWTAGGELVWDVERRTLRSLHVEAIERTEVVTVRDLEGVAGEPTYVQTMRLAGRTRLTVQVAAP